MSGEAPEAPALRASDADRERTAAQLREHSADGRITADELDERLGAAYAARTVAELQAQLHDLPQLPAHRTPPSHSPEREQAKRRVLHAVGLAVLVNVAALVLWAATGAGGAYWPKWLLLVSVVRLGFYAWGELGPGGGDSARLGRGSAAPVARHHRDRRREEARDPRDPR